MDTAFRILVYAIAAILLIMLFLNYIVPYFFPAQNAEKEIGKLLIEAEFSLGKYKSSRVQLEAGSSLLAENFDSGNRSVAFSCNSAELCLDYVEYEERKINVKRSIQAAVSARCTYAYGLFTCKIYFGKEPAQLKLMNVEVNDSIDLGKNENIAQFAVKNSGKIEARNIKAIAKIYKRYFAENEWHKEFVRQSEKELGNLNAGAVMNAEIELPVEESGTYALEIITSAEEAGFDSAEKNFEAVGAINLCKATAQEGFAIYNSAAGKCREKSFCENCFYAYECRDAWKEKNAQKTFESGEPDFAYEVSEALEGAC